MDIRVSVRVSVSQNIGRYVISAKGNGAIR